MPSSISYDLFVYREQLKLNRTKEWGKQKAKLNLTKGLVKKSLKSITENCNLEGVKCLRRSIEYKMELERLMKRRIKLALSKKNKQ